jgi:hypothetical protein
MLDLGGSMSRALATCVALHLAVTTALAAEPTDWSPGEVSGHVAWMTSAPLACRAQPDGAAAVVLQLPAQSALALVIGPNGQPTTTLRYDASSGVNRLWGMTTARCWIPLLRRAVAPLRPGVQAP